MIMNFELFPYRILCILFIQPRLDFIWNMANKSKARFSPCKIQQSAILHVYIGSGWLHRLRLEAWHQSHKQGLHPCKSSTLSTKQISPWPRATPVVMSHPATRASRTQPSPNQGSSLCAELGASSLCHGKDLPATLLPFTLEPWKTAAHRCATPAPLAAETTFQSKQAWKCEA